MSCVSTGKDNTVRSVSQTYLATEFFSHGFFLSLEHLVQLMSQGTLFGKQCFEDYQYARCLRVEAWNAVPKMPKRGEAWQPLPAPPANLVNVSPQTHRQPTWGAVTSYLTTSRKHFFKALGKKREKKR